MGAPSTNDFCSALALDACCMQRPMRRKVRWSSLLPPDTHTHTHTNVTNFYHCQKTTRGSRGKRWWSLLTCAFFLSCMNVVPGDEGDQDGSLYFLLNRWCFACLFFGFNSLINVLSVRIPLKVFENKRNRNKKMTLWSNNNYNNADGNNEENQPPPPVSLYDNN